MEIVETARALASNELRPRADETDRSGAFPKAQLRALADAGLMGMAVPRALGGRGDAPAVQARIFRELAVGCVTSAFVLSQHHVVTALLSVSPNQAQRETWLPGLASGEIRGADGINFLKMPAERAPMRAKAVEGGWILDGMLPWVTAAHHSDVLVCGALLPDGQQIVVGIPMDERVRRGEAADLMAFEASDTGPVFLDGCFVPNDALVLGPDPDVLSVTPRIATAYVPIAMALGHASSSMAACADGVRFKGPEAARLFEQTQTALDELEREMLAAVDVENPNPSATLRGRANFLVQRAAHLALIVGGGTAFRREALAQRLYREAAFWSVWSVGGPITPNMLAVLIEAAPGVRA